MSNDIGYLTQGEIEALLEIAIFIENRVPACITRLHGKKESTVKTLFEGSQILPLKPDWEFACCVSTKAYFDREDGILEDAFSEYDPSGILLAEYQTDWEMAI